MNIQILGTIENIPKGIFRSDSTQNKYNLKDITFLGKINLSETIIKFLENGKSFIEERDKLLNNNFKNIINSIIGGNKKWE